MLNATIIIKPPTNAVDDAIYLTSIYSKRFCQRFFGFTSRSQFSNRFCISKIKLSASAPSVFLRKILPVHAVISSKQMIWAYASVVITFVQHAVSFWNRAAVYNPTCTMCGDTSLAPLSNTRVHPSIPWAKFVGSPHPTWTKFLAMLWNGSVFINLLPKSKGGCDGKSLRGKILSGKFWRHNQSSFLVLLARRRRQPPRALFDLTRHLPPVNERIPCG